jgi:hypothetical protein
MKEAHLEAPSIVGPDPIPQTIKIYSDFAVHWSPKGWDVIPRLQEIVGELIVQVRDPVHSLLYTHLILIHHDRD